MRLRYVELRNYRKFRHVALELGEGVTGILGQNGTGKSSLVEAVAWALFGNEASIVRTTKEGVRSAAAGPNEECSVTLEFDLEGDRYHLVRSLKGKDCRSDATLLVNDMLVARTDKAVTEAMEERLGMDHKSFFVSVFARQKDLNALSNLRPAQRRELVLRMLGVEAIDSVLAEISSDLRSCKDGLDALSSTLTTPDGKDRRTTIEQRIDVLVEGKLALGDRAERLRSEMDPMIKGAEVARHSMEEAERKAEVHAALATKLAALEADLRARSSRLVRVEADLKALEARRADLPALEAVVAKQDGLRLEKERLEEQRLRQRERDSLAESLGERSSQLTEIDGEMDSIKKNLEGLGDQSAVLTSLEEALSTNSSTMEELRDRVSRHLSDRKRYQEEAAKRASKKKDIASLGPESACPTCERKLEGHYQKLIAKMDEEVTELQTQANQAKERADEANRNLDRSSKSRAGLEARQKEALRKRDDILRFRTRSDSLDAARLRVSSELEGLRTRIDDIGEVAFDQDRYLVVRSGLEDGQRRGDALTKLRTELGRTEVLETERLQLTKDRKDRMLEVGQVKDDVSRLSFETDQVKKARDLYVQWRDRKDATQKQIADIGTEWARLEGEERAARARLIEIEETMVQAEERRKGLMELNVLAEAMKDFRANIIARVVPSLSQMASELFVELTDGKYGGLRLDEEYEVHVMDEGREYPLDRFSGGESDLASLCLRLAISRMIGERSGHHVDFLVLDEIFGSQDINRKRNVLEMLNSLQRQFGQIVVITHIEDIKDALGNSVTVEEGADGYSKVSIA